MIASPSARADTNDAWPTDQVKSAELCVQSNVETRTSLQAAPLLVNAQGWFKAGSRYYILRGVPDNIWATSAARARWIKDGVDYHIRGAGPVTVFTTNWTSLPYRNFFMPNGVREVSVFNFKPAPKDDDAISSGAEHFGETLWGTNAFCGIKPGDGSCTPASSFSWNVSVGFKCDNGRCYFTAETGVSYSHADAQRQIDAAIQLMIQQEASKGAKPTGQVNANIKKNR